MNSGAMLVSGSIIDLTECTQTIVVNECSGLFIFTIVPNWIVRPLEFPTSAKFREIHLLPGVVVLGCLDIGTQDIQHHIEIEVRTLGNVYNFIHSRICSTEIKTL